MAPSAQRVTSSAVRRIARPVLAAIVASGMALSDAHAGTLKAGWTAEVLATETADCTKAQVQGAWEQTKREQGIAAGVALSEEMLKELEPQIAGMRLRCACAVRAGAERYSKAEADREPAAFDRFVAERIANGACKSAPTGR